MKPWFKIITILIVIGFISALLVNVFIYNKPHPDIEKMDAAYTLPAADLYTAFTGNKTGAGNKFNGKVIAVTGKLTKVEAADSLATCVFVFGRGMFGDEGLRCTMLPAYKEQVKSFQPGHEIRIKGYCTGYNDTDVIMEKCLIVKY